MDTSGLHRVGGGGCKIIREQLAVMNASLAVHGRSRVCPFTVADCWAQRLEVIGLTFGGSVQLLGWQSRRGMELPWLQKKSVQPDRVDPAALTVDEVYLSLSYWAILYSFSRLRPMIIFWISEVPSPISMKAASRYKRSISNSFE